MKKFIFSLFALIGIAASVSAQKVTVADVEAVPGQTVKATLNFECPADKYTGMQISLQFPSSDFTMADKKAITGWDGLLEYNMKGGKVSYSAAGSEKYSSVAIEVEFTVGESVAVGECNVNISGQLEGPGVDDAPISGSFKVNVVNRLTLDEESTIAPTATGKAVNLLVKRTIKARTWSTICLPFDMTTDQWQGVFGADAKLHRLNGYKKDGDAIKVTFKDALSGKFLANKPYVIKTQKDISEFEVTAELKPNSGKESILNDDEDEIAYAKGIYKAETAIPEDNVFVSGGQFYYSDGTIKSKAFRAYFWFADKAATSRIIMSFDDETTGIKDLNAGDSDKVFDLQGRSVKTPAKGVYIKGGKKVMVK